MRESPRHDHVHVTYCEPSHVHKCPTEYELPGTLEDQNNSLINGHQGLNYLNYFFGVSPLACKDVGHWAHSHGKYLGWWVGECASYM